MLIFYIRVNHVGMISSGVVTVQDSQSGKSFSLIQSLAKNVQKPTNKMFKRTKHPKKAISLCLSYSNYMIKRS